MKGERKEEMERNKGGGGKRRRQKPLTHAYPFPSIAISLLSCPLRAQPFTSFEYNNQSIGAR